MRRRTRLPQKVKLENPWHAGVHLPFCVCPLYIPSLPTFRLVHRAAGQRRLAVQVAEHEALDAQRGAAAATAAAGAAAVQASAAEAHKQAVAQAKQVAEVAKVLESTQRDLNIALINKLAVISNKMGIDTQAVLEAAGSK